MSNDREQEKRIRELRQLEEEIMRKKQQGDKYFALAMVVFIIMIVAVKVIEVINQ